VNIASGNIPILVSVAVFVSITLLLLGFLYYLFQRAKRQELLNKLAHDEMANSPSGANGSKGTEMLNVLSSLGKRVAPMTSVDHSEIRIKFLRAGFRNPNVYYVFWGVKVLFGVLLPVSFLFLRFTMFEVINNPLTVILSVFMAFMGLYIPELLLRIRTAMRKEKIRDGFANVLDLLVVCIEAGMGLDAAMNRVGQEIELNNKEWGEELRLFNLELRAGMLRRDALKNLALRTDIEDVGSLATSLIEADKFGTSIAQSLRVYSDSFRTKCYQKAEAIAAKLPVKLVFPAILFIFPSLFVAIVGSAAIRVFQMFLQG
jgi:tight adherence protein C